jgi:putative FmdB family regulatory protein
VPRYDYRCEAGHKYEAQEPFGSPSTHACPKCGKLAQRQLSPPTVIFKGSGFYKTSGKSGPGPRPAKEPDSAARSKTPPGGEAGEAPNPSTSHSTPAASDE